MMKKMFNHYLDVLRVRNVWVITLMAFCYSLTFYTTIYTLLLQERGLDYWQIFLLEGVLSAFIFLFEVPAGYVADRLGRKRVVLVAVGCYLLSNLLLIVAHEYWVFLLEAAVGGIGIACLSGADSALLYESLEDEGKSDKADYVFALQSGAFTAAMVLSLPVGGFVGAQSFEATLYLTTGATAIAFLLACLIRERGQHSQAGGQEKQGRWGGFLRTLGRIVREQPALLFLQLLIGMSFTAIFSLHYLQLPLFQSYGLAVETFGMILLGSYVLNLLITFFVPALGRLLGARMIFVMSMLLAGGFFLILASSVEPVIGVGVLLLILAVQTVCAPVYRTFLNERIDGENRATTLSVISLVGSIVGMGMKPLIGYLADHGLAFAFGVIGLLIMAGALVVFWITARLTRTVQTES